MNLGTAANAADIIGAAGALVAIYFGVRALQDGNRVREEAADERRRQFELEILREILDGVDSGLLYLVGGDPDRLKQYRFRLDLLPKAEMPLWRAMLTMKWQDQVSEHLGFKEAWHAKSVEIGESAKRADSAENYLEWEEAHAKLADEVSQIATTFHATVATRLLQELMGAITVRVEAGRFGSSSRTWWGRRRKPVGHVD